MTYEEFLNIPVSAIKDLETIFRLKRRWGLDFTSEELEIRNHIITFYEGQKLSKTKQELEKLFKL